MEKPKLFILERPGDCLFALSVRNRTLELTADIAGQDQWMGSCFLGRLTQFAPELSAWFVDIGLEKAGIVSSHLVNSFCKHRPKAAGSQKPTAGMYLPFQAVAEMRENKGLRLKPLLQKIKGSQKQNGNKPKCLLDLRNGQQRLLNLYQLSTDQVELETLEQAPERKDLSFFLDERFQPEISFALGSVSFHPTPAGTMIDINAKGDAFPANMQACLLIAKEVQQRNLSGQIFIDFASMPTKNERNQVVEELKKAFQDWNFKDRRALAFGGMGGDSCLVIRRQRIGAALHEIFMKPATSPETGWRMRGTTLVTRELEQAVQQKRENVDWAKRETLAYQTPFKLSGAFEASAVACLSKAFIDLRFEGKNDIEQIKER